MKIQVLLDVYKLVNWRYFSLLNFFDTGKFIMGEFTSFIIYLIIAAISVSIIYINLSKIGWKTVIK
jgi:hypothetical protein